MEFQQALLSQLLRGPSFLHKLEQILSLLNTEKEKNVLVSLYLNAKMLNES